MTAEQEQAKRCEWISLVELFIAAPTLEPREALVRSWDCCYNVCSLNDDECDGCAFDGPDGMVCCAGFSSASSGNVDNTAFHLMCLDYIARAKVAYPECFVKEART